MKNFVYSLLVISMLAGCKGGNDDGTTESDKKSEISRYGGTLRLAKNEPCGDIHPLFVKDIHSFQMALNIFESLLKFNSRTLEVENCLAESIEKTEDNTLYVIKLKKGVKFHDDPCFNNGRGREVTASDVKYSFEQLCTNVPGNSFYQITFKNVVVGANEFYDGDSEQLTGVQVIDDHTIEIRLIQNYPTFDHILASLGCSIIPEEGVDKYGIQIRVGTGPFIYQSALDKANGIILLKNQHYHVKDEKGNTLPYLDSLSFVYVKDIHQQWVMFENGELDYIESVPSEKVKRIVESNRADFEDHKPKHAKFILGVDDLMSSMFISFNLTQKPLNNKKVRQALSYAINRGRIIEDILGGGAKGPAQYGITPPAVNSKYDVSSIQGYSYNPKKAKQLLSEAGFPNGKGFPGIKLETSSFRGEVRGRIAFEIADHWKKVLGINVELEIVPLKTLIRDESQGIGGAYLTGWVADFPNPESFLTLGYGKNVPASLSESSWPNSSRYVNPEFDKLFEKARMTTSESERFGYFLEAEQILINDAPICPLWYVDNYNLRRSELWNFYTNGMELFNYTKVYKKDRLAKDKPIQEKAEVPL